MKNVICMIGLVVGYLLLLIVLKQIGLNDFFNVVFSSCVLGATLKLWISSFIIDVIALISITLIYFFAHDFYLLLVMSVSCILGYWAVRMYRHHKKNQQNQKLHSSSL